MRSNIPLENKTLNRSIARIFVERPTMKLLRLKKGEPAYISIPKDSIISIEYTKITKGKEKLVLVKVI